MLDKVVEQQLYAKVIDSAAEKDRGELPLADFFVIELFAGKGEQFDLFEPFAMHIRMQEFADAGVFCAGDLLDGFGTALALVGK